MPFQLRCWCKCWEWVSIRNVKFSSSFCQTYYCVSDISWFDWNITSICHLQSCFFKKALQKSRGTRTLVPFHVNQQVFVFISRMGFRNITLSFSSECVYVFLTLPDFIRTLPVKMRIRNKENATKNCGGTRSLVPFQVDNWVFYCNLENVHQEYQFVFYTKCIYVFLTFPGFIRILPA